MRNLKAIAVLSIFASGMAGPSCLAAEASPAPKAAKLSAPLSAPKAAKPLGKKVAKLGAPKPAAAPVPSKKSEADRAAEVKRLTEYFDKMCLGYVNRLVQAKTPEEVAAITARAPSGKWLRSYARLFGQMVATDATDEPARDALLFLAKYAGVPECDALLAEVPGAEPDSPTTKVDPLALLLEHHADDAMIAKMLRSMPAGEATDTFCQSLFEKTRNPEVRAASGIRLFPSLIKAEKEAEAEELAVAMSEDRYLDGVPITSRPNGPTARSWAEGKLREIRLLGVGKVLPEVFGETLDGETETLSGYRGKVVVLDIWATWCGPCVAMIPHEREMAERLADQPFAILSVSTDRDKEKLAEFLEVTPMPWDHWWVGTDSPLTKSLAISRYPTIFVLDQEGVIRYKDLKEEDLEAAVNTLLGLEDEAGDDTETSSSDES